MWKRNIFQFPQYVIFIKIYLYKGQRSAQNHIWKRCELQNGICVLFLNEIQRSEFRLTGCRVQHFHCIILSYMSYDIEHQRLQSSGMWRCRLLRYIDKYLSNYTKASIVEPKLLIELLNQENTCSAPHYRRGNLGHFVTVCEFSLDYINNYNRLLFKQNSMLLRL
jgi:hypothetical protein